MAYWDWLEGDPKKRQIAQNYREKIHFFLSLSIDTWAVSTLYASATAHVHHHGRKRHFFLAILIQFFLSPNL
jgi:hypothetical protein